MDFKGIIEVGEDTVLTDLVHFDLGTILDCGQAFRWEALGSDSYAGIVQNRRLLLTQKGNRLIFHQTTRQDFHSLWRDYFDLDRDYGALKDTLRADPALDKAVAFCPGMRILRQSPWETLCSFIISQNNNIPRIKGIIARLCQAYGESLPDGGYAFPGPDALASLPVEDLACIRAGFRARYLLDAARKVAEGSLDLDSLYTLPLPQARIQLQTICGVGPKVAECVLLYAFGRTQCFPVDVWMSRALRLYYPGGFPGELEEWAGLAQQYLFHYIRSGSAG